MMAQLTGPDFGLPVAAHDSLAHLIRQAAKQSPSARFVELALDGEPLQVTCGELFEQALSLCEQVKSIDPELPLILAFGRAGDFVPAAWAAILLGRWYVPWQITPASNAGSAFHARLGALKQCFPEAGFITNAGLETAKQKILAECPDWSVRQVDPRRGVTNYSSVAARDSEAGCYLPTSGTMGGARFARIREQTLYFRCTAMQPQRTDRVAMNCFPFDGVTGHNVIFPWTGTRLVLNTSRLMSRPGDVPDLIRQHKVGALNLSTTMLARLVAVLEKQLNSNSLSSLYRVSLGAEPLSPVLIRRFLACCEKAGAGDVSISLGYGMTETSLIATEDLQTPAKSLMHIGNGAEPVRLGSCSRYTALRVTDEDDRLLPVGTRGHIQVRSTHRMFDGYRIGVSLDRSCFTVDGWFRTGDLGAIERGQLIVFGRDSGSMSLGGRSISLEQIEVGLQGVAGVEPGTLVAAAVRSQEVITDELALFYSPESDGNMNSRQLADRLRRAVISLIGVSPEYLIPVPAGRITRTASAKVIRPLLVEAFQAGELEALEIKAQNLCSESPFENRLRQIWAQQLKIDPGFASESDFFKLGADSLDAADMILRVEDEFNVRLPLEQFFRCPTLDELARLVISSAHGASAAAKATDGLGRESLRKLELFMATWPGERRTPDSLIVALNKTGTGIPLFWVFQERREFLSLAKALGDDYPLYGLRSMVGIVPVREYGVRMLNTVCDLYVPEILALKPQGPFIIGGNCQGGIIALAVSRRLQRMGRQPHKLVLMEWSYSYGSYGGHVELLYGRDSYTARYYTRDCADGPDWRADFRKCNVNAIDGAHGAFFTEKNLGSLSDQARRILSDVSR